MTSHWTTQGPHQLGNTSKPLEQGEQADLEMVARFKKSRLSGNIVVMRQVSDQARKLIH